MNDAFGWPQSVLVFGGGSDIALATTEALVARRARRIVLAGRHPEGYGAATASLLALGAESVDAAHFDADDTASHRQVVDDAFRRLGDVDLVLLAFGVLGAGLDAEHDPEAAVALARTNYLGALSVGLHVARRLRSQGHGVVVALSSVAAERPRHNFVYGSSKAGLDAFARGLGDSLAGSGVRVLVVRPGFVASKMTEGLRPMPLSTTTDKVAQVVVQALETGREEVWAPPALRYLMSAVRHLPRPVFRRLERAMR